MHEKENVIVNLQKANEALRDAFPDKTEEAALARRENGKYINDLMQRFKVIEEAIPMMRSLKKEVTNIRDDHNRFRDLCSDLVQ